MIPVSVKRNVSPRSERWSWWTSLFVLCAILGGLMGLSFKTQNRVLQQNLPSNNYNGLAERYMILKGAVDDRSRTIKALQEAIQRLQSSTSSDTQQTRVLSDNLKQADFLAGLTAVQGPGVVITLSDSKKSMPPLPAGVAPPNIIHDTDIQQVLNELKAAGAEALSVNDQRIIAVSPVRCAGPTILINNVPQAPGPGYLIRAIGDPKTLASALNLPGGVIEQLQQFDPAMFKIQPRTQITVPAYAGPTQPKYAQPVPVAVAQKAKE